MDTLDDAVEAGPIRSPQAGASFKATAERRVCLQLKTPGSLGQHANYVSPGSLSLCVGVELLEPHPLRTSSNNFAVILRLFFFAAPECNTEPLPPVATLLAAKLASITQHAVQRRNLGNVL